MLSSFGILPNLGFGELVLVLVLALIIFGPGKLPEVGKAVGKGIREFKKSVNGIADENSPVKNPDSDIIGPS